MPTPQETIAEYFAAIRAMDPVRWANTFDTDAVSHDPVGAPPMQGHEALKAFLAHVTSLFTQVGLTEDNVFINGNKAAVKWTGRGTGKNGAQVTFEGIDVIECNDDGKIATVHAYWDPAPMLAAVTPKS